MKKKLHDMLLSIFGKEKPTKYTAEDMTKIEAECQKIFGKTFLEVMADVQNETTNALTLSEEHQQILDALFEGEGGDNAPEGNDAGGKKEDPLQKITEMKNQIAQLEAENKLLGNQPEPINPSRMSLHVIPVTGGAHTDKYLFGIEAPLFAMENKPWNLIAAKKQPLEVIGSTMGVDSSWTKELHQMFTGELEAYGMSVARRIGQLQAENRLSTIKMSEIDTTGFTGTKWGEEYVVRRQDMLIAFVRSANSWLGIIPTRYGVQNKDVMTNITITSVSQSYQSGRITKGKTAVEPIEAVVHDLMIKYAFSNMKKLEKAYIGYLNQEGSQPMKWTMIEYVMSLILLKAQNEQNERKALGVRVEPTEGTSGHYLHGSDGLFKKLWKYAYEDFRIQPMTDIIGYSSSTMLANAKAFVDKVNEKLPNLNNYVLYYNEKHRPWYLQNYRAAYGKDFDFAGGKMSVMDYPETEMVGLPNFGNFTFFVLAEKGNLEFLEFLAGEMAKLDTQRDMETLYVFSYWKEGIEGSKVGLKHATAAALAADDYQSQYVFMSYPYIDLVADATTIDASKGMFFKTASNTAAKAIASISGARAGVVIRIECNGTTNATTIAKSGVFSEITATYTPTAIGDYIEVYRYYNEDDSTDAKNNKFIEVGRKVTA